MLQRLARASYQHPWRAVAGWVLILVAVFGAVGVVGAAFDNTFQIPASESRRGFDALDAHFGGAGSGQSGSIVFRARQGVDDPAVRSAMEAMFAEVATYRGVQVTSPYSEQGTAQVNPDRTVAYASLSLQQDLDFNTTAEYGADMAKIRPQIDGLTVEIGGGALAEFKPPESEFIGLSFAVVVLILAFGSVLAMGLPLSVAVVGVGTGIGLVSLISNLISMPDFATTIGAMIGLGVGIDYALFIVTRFREGLHAGEGPEQSTVVAMNTAGRAVIFAGLTVVISLLGMLLMGLAFIAGLGIGAAVTVLTTMLASITLLPALLGFARERVEVTRWYGLLAAGFVSLALFGAGLGITALLVGFPIAVLVFIGGRWVPTLKELVPKRAPGAPQRAVAYRWSRMVQAHPWLAVFVGSAILIALASPMLSLRLGFSDEGNYREETTTRRAYDLLAEGFGPGFNGPLLVTAEVRNDADRNALQPLVAALKGADGVASVSPPIPSDRANPNASPAYLVQVVPTTAPQDAATSDLVNRLRQEVIPGALGGSTLAVNITGTVAANIDFSDYLAGRLLLFFGAVLTLSFLLLMAVFRSVVVPLKAVVMNVLSIGAAYGVVIAIFQWGWFGWLFGTAEAPIEPFIPMMMFAIVFGLSMDYEVFLLSRVKEEYDRSGNAFTSVADGLASTARVITAAAAIMVVVFGSFMFEDDRVVKLFGVGLATAVLLDASVVRMLLVPATMELLGKSNWWLPGWLDRVLPRISVEAPPQVVAAPVRVEGGDE
ncbi:MAG: MMPL family transporter [Dehalococcoidia bacterium]|nr:MMPL family transporter [Dehalococcoidia bacterium]